MLNVVKKISTTLGVCLITYMTLSYMLKYSEKKQEKKNLKDFKHQAFTKQRDENIEKIIKLREAA